MLVTTILIAAVTGGSAFAGSTTTSLSGPESSTTFGEAASFAAGVSGVGPTGTVTFKDGTNTLGSGPVALRGAMPTSLSAGRDYVCVVNVAGGIECWGYNGFGQLGNGNQTNQNIPVAVSGLTSGIVAVAAGGFHTCALTDAGAVKCWGRNSDGQLGVPASGSILTPVDVTGLSSGVKAISAGYYHTCALTDAGTVKCWGDNASGQLGDGTTADRSTPAAVSGPAGTATAIVAGEYHSCLLSDGGAHCWGDNSRGQLGDGSTVERHVPTAVTGLASGVESITAGEEHTCARTDTGAAKCWGYNAYGQLGDDNAPTNQHIPTAVSGYASGTAAIAAGAQHTCALNAGGAAKCWGRSNHGQVGDGGTTDRSTPVPVSGLSSGGAVLAGGLSHSCALLESGAAQCWGDNNYGQLGNGNSPTDSSIPVSVTGFGAGAALVPGTATFSTTSLPAGSRSITAHYGGDGGNDASASPALTHVVDKGDTKATIKLKPKKPKAGKSVRIKIAIAAVAPASGKPDGKVTVKDGRKKLGKFKVKNGKAKIKLRDLKAGKHKLKAKYPGDGNWNRSAAKTKITAK